MSWLKTATLNAQTPKVGVIDALRQNMGGYQLARSIEVLHASDTTKPGFCPRHLALLMLHEQTKKDEYIGTALQATFDVGKLTAAVLVEKWMGQKAVGNWSCERCGSQVTMQAKPNTPCSSKYGSHRWEYVEPVFVSKEYGISGSLDLLADIGPKLIVTELKIMKGEDWEKLLAPLPEHRERTALYLKLVADSDSVYKDLINVHEARVLYISRAYGKKHVQYNDILPFKEFVVTRDDACLEPLLKKAKQVKIFKEQKLMPQGICNTALDKYAKGCTTCTACFSGKYPPQQESFV